MEFWKFTFVFLLLFLPTRLLAGITEILEGTVVDRDSGDPLVGVSVAIPPRSNETAPSYEENRQPSPWLS